MRQRSQAGNHPRTEPWRWNQVNNRRWTALPEVLLTFGSNTVYWTTCQSTCWYLAWPPRMNWHRLLRTAPGCSWDCINQQRSRQHHQENPKTILTAFSLQDVDFHHTYTALRKIELNMRHWGRWRCYSMTKLFTAALKSIFPAHHPVTITLAPENGAWRK